MADNHRMDASALLSSYRPRGEAENRATERVGALVTTVADPWLRSLPLHLTASALVVHPDSGKVLLRWHERQQAWLQVGGHGDPGESDPLAIALREAREETGLADLAPWPDGQLRHLAIVRVPAAGTPTTATCRICPSGHGARSASPVSSPASLSAMASGSLSPGSACPPT